MIQRAAMISWQRNKDELYRSNVDYVTQKAWTARTSKVQIELLDWTMLLLP